MSNKNNQKEKKTSIRHSLLYPAFLLPFLPLNSPRPAFATSAPCHPTRRPRVNRA